MLPVLLEHDVGVFHDEHLDAGQKVKVGLEERPQTQRRRQQHVRRVETGVQLRPNSEPNND